MGGVRQRTRRSNASPAEVDPYPEGPDVRTTDAGRISASYKDGVLAIRLPQREEAKPKQIAVNVE